MVVWGSRCFDWKRPCFGGLSPSKIEVKWVLFWYPKEKSPQQIRRNSIQQKNELYQNRKNIKIVGSWAFFSQKPFAVSSQPNVDGRNPANQLICVVYPTIYEILDIPGGDRRISEPSTVWVFCWCSSIQPTNLPSTYRSFLAPPTLKPPHHLGRKTRVKNGVVFRYEKTPSPPEFVYGLGGCWVFWNPLLSPKRTNISCKIMVGRKTIYLLKWSLSGHMLIYGGCY